jgi:hypothetical protein
VIVRAPRPEGNFYLLDKRISEDGRLSWAARGLLIYLLGKPDHWQVSPQALVNETANSTRPAGRDAVYAVLAELGAVGYIAKIRERMADGTLGPVHYLVGENAGTPQTEKPEVAPHPGYPDVVQPDTVNPTQVSIDGKQGLSAARNDRRKAKAVHVGFDLMTGQFTNLEQQAMDLRAAYPSVSLDAEVNRAAIWIVANPAKRPVKNFGRFLASWLGRAQERIDMEKRAGIVPQARGGNYTEQKAAFVNELTGKTSNVVPLHQMEVIDG